MADCITVCAVPASGGSGVAPTLASWHLRGCVGLDTCKVRRMRLRNRRQFHSLFISFVGLVGRQERVFGGAFVFEGPPGTGKTTTARIVARKVDKPMVPNSSLHSSVPLCRPLFCAQVVLSFEQIASPYLGETETMLAEVFDLITRMDGAVLFIDEVWEA